MQPQKSSFADFRKGHLNIRIDDIPEMSDDNNIKTELYKMFCQYGVRVSTVEKMGLKAKKSSITQFPKIKQLTIQNANELVIEYIQEVLSMFTNLEDLNIQAKSDDSYPKTSMTSLIHAVQGDTTNPKLNTLCNVPYKELQSNASQLNLSNKEIGSDGAMVIKTMQLPSTLTKLDISNNQLGSVGASFLADAIKDHTTLENLDISNNKLVPPSTPGNSWLTALVDAIHTMTKLTTLNISANNICDRVQGEPWGATYFAKSIANHRTLSTLTFSGALLRLGHKELIVLELDQNEADLSNKGLGEGGAIIVGAWISLMRSRDKHLVKLNVRHNGLGEKGTVPLALALRGNDTITELNLAENNMGKNGSERIAEIIPTMTALTKLIVGNDFQNEPHGLATLEIGMTTLNFFRKNLETGDAVIINKWISDKDTGKLTSVNLLRNHIDLEQTNALVATLEQTENLKSLCGNTGVESELNMCNQLGSYGAIMLAPEIVANPYLQDLDISNNNIGRLVPSGGWTKEYSEDGFRTWYKHTDGRKQSECPAGSLPQNAITLANAIKQKKKSLTKLNIRNTGLGNLTLPEGWTFDSSRKKWLHPSGSLDSAPIDAKAEGANAFTEVISESTTLTSVNILENHMGTELAKTFAEILQNHHTLKSLCGNLGTETDLNMRGKKMAEDGAIMLPPEILANRALETLDASRNYMFGWKHNSIAIRAWANVLSHSTSLIDLNLAYNRITDSDAAILATGLKANSQLKKFNISNNRIGVKGGTALAEALMDKKQIEELNFANNQLIYENIDDTTTSMSGVEQICVAIPTMTALNSLNLSRNGLGQDIVKDGWVLTSKQGEMDAFVQDFFDKHRRDSFCYKNAKKQSAKSTKDTAVRDRFGLIAIEKAIEESKALTTLDISENGIPRNNKRKLFTACKGKEITLIA